MVAVLFQVTVASRIPSMGRLLIQRFASTEEVATTVACLVTPLASATTVAPTRMKGFIIKCAF